MNEQAFLPLAGQTVLVTRPENQAHSLVGLLERQGAELMRQPMIEIREPEDWSLVDAVIERISEFSWLVFVSVNGVHFFRARCVTLGVSLQPRIPPKIAAIGAKTSSELQRVGWAVTLIPDEFDSGGLANALVNRIDKEKVLLIRANRGSAEIPLALAAAGIEFEQIAVYQSTDVKTADPEVTAALSRGEISWVTVTSSAIARSLVNVLGDHLRQTKLVSISPTTSQQLRKLGFEPAAEAQEYHMAGLVDAMIQHS
jgi:uroporphyrinogen III methyltransferase/synthase